MVDTSKSVLGTDGQAKRLAIFRAGKHVSVDGREINFSAADVADLAASYDPAVHEAPIVIGHPKLEAPAYGWGKTLTVEDGVLYAQPHQVEPQFAELVNAGRYKKISSSIYMPDTPGNPKPGRFYLRHIGFLGAQPPAVKGLPNAEFAEDDSAVEFADDDGATDGLLDRLVSKLASHMRTAEERIAADQVGNPATHFAERAAARETHEEKDMTDKNKDGAVDLAEQQRKIDEQKADIEKREKALADKEKAIGDTAAKEARTEAAHFADQLVTAGKILPRHKAGIVELQIALGSAPVSFSEGDEKREEPASEVLRKFLADLPTQVDFAEKSAATGGAEAAAVDFAAPAGVGVDSTRMELHAKAKAYQRTHKDVTFADAVKAVGG